MIFLGADHAQSTKVLDVSQKFSTGKLGLNKKQRDRDEKEASTKDLACRFVKNFSVVGQTYQPSPVFGDALNKCFIFLY